MRSLTAIVSRATILVAGKMTRKITFGPLHDLLQHAKHEAVERNMTLRGARLQLSRPVGPANRLAVATVARVISCLVSGLRARPVRRCNKFLSLSSRKYYTATVSIQFTTCSSSR
jgi:hypothetical protein